MKIYVEAQGVLQKFIKGDGKRMALEVEDGTTVGALLHQMGVTQDVDYNAALNDQLAYPEDPLIEGATLFIFPPIAGG
jgi:molybdopterin converting factor small subunit